MERAGSTAGRQPRPGSEASWLAGPTSPSSNPPHHTHQQLTIQAMATLPPIHVSNPQRQSPLAMGSPQARHVLRPLRACSKVTTSPILRAWGKRIHSEGWHSEAAGAAL